MALFDSAIGGCYCCVSSSLPPPPSSPECIGFACFFCCKRQIRKSEKQNQTFPPRPFSCQALSGNSGQYWCRPALVGKGVKYAETLPAHVDVIQLSGLIPECSLTWIQCYMCCRAGNSGQRRMKCLTVIKLHTGRKRRTGTAS